MNISTSDSNEIERPVFTSIDDNDGVKQSTDISADNETHLEQPTEDPVE
jgi:hypothetical protein